MSEDWSDWSSQVLSILYDILVNLIWMSHWYMTFFLPKESVVIVEKMHLYIQKLISFTNKGVAWIMFFFIRNSATQLPV
jgi:hypothetical protein